jgi:hypothetical protein
MTVTAIPDDLKTRYRLGREELRAAAKTVESITIGRLACAACAAARAARAACAAGHPSAAAAAGACSRPSFVARPDRRAPRVASLVA